MGLDYKKEIKKVEKSFFFITSTNYLSNSNFAYIFLFSRFVIFKPFIEIIIKWQTRCENSYVKVEFQPRIEVGGVNILPVVAAYFKSLPQSIRKQ